MFTQYIVQVSTTIDLQHTLNTFTTAIESDQSTITNMTEHNNHLTKQLNQVIAGIGTATDTIVTLQSQLNALTYSDRGRGGGGGSRDSSSGTGTGVGTTEDKPHHFDFNREPKRKFYNNKNYCHTHGYHITDSHTNNTCLNPGTGHKKDVTRANTIGDSTIGASVCL